MDDGFDWLDTLPTDLQHRIWHLMDCVADGRHAQVEAIVPGLVARARAEERPWVEIFARNFGLRSKVLHQEDISDGLGEAIALLDRAHQPDAADCPQTICTAHAVCAAYGFKDPTGYIDERLSVSTETLARTDPRRVCWLCISNEHADALIDAGRPDDALTWLAEQRRTRLTAGARVDPDDFGLREAAAHVLAGRLDAAHAALDACADAERGASWQRTWRQWKARVLAEQGELDAAAPLLSSVDDILDDGGFRLHFETAPLLFGKLSDEARAQTSLDDDELIRQMCVLGRACIARGGGAGVGALLWAAEHLVDDGEPTLARAALEGARPGVQALRDATAVEARMRALEGRIEALEDRSAKPAEPPTPTESTQQSFEGGLAALRAEPSLDGLRPLVSVARAFGLPELARTLAVETRQAAPDDDALFDFTAQILLDAGDTAALDAQLARPPATADGPMLATWLRGLAAERRGDADAATRCLTTVAAQRPGWAHVCDRLGRMHFDAGRFAEADAVWGATADAIGGVNDFHWHCMCAATAAGDWDRLRALAGIVDFPVPGERGPFEADYGLVRVRYEDDPHPYFAQRTGPLSARILSLRAPGRPSRHGDRVLYHPASIEDDEDGPPVRRMLLCLDPSDHVTVDLDGLDPGEAAIDDLREALQDAGFFFQFGAGSEYEVVDPETEESHPGLYLLIAARPAELPALHAILDAIPGPGPRVWPALLEHLGRADEAAKHRATAEAWGMV